MKAVKLFFLETELPPGKLFKKSVFDHCYLTGAFPEAVRTKDGWEWAEGEEDLTAAARVLHKRHSLFRTVAQEVIIWSNSKVMRPSENGIY